MVPRLAAAEGWSLEVNGGSASLLDGKPAEGGDGDEGRERRD